MDPVLPEVFIVAEEAWLMQSPSSSNVQIYHEWTLRSHSVPQTGTGAPALIFEVINWFQFFLSSFFFFFMGVP